MIKKWPEKKLTTWKLTFMLLNNLMIKEEIKTENLLKAWKDEPLTIFNLPMNIYWAPAMAKKHFAKQVRMWRQMWGTSLLSLQLSYFSFPGESESKESACSARDLGL